MNKSHMEFIPFLSSWKSLSILGLLYELLEYPKKIGNFEARYLYAERKV
jgi:hypothetical protein